MAHRSPLLWPIVTAVVAVVVIILALPPSMRTWAPSFLAAPDFHLGLDLAGGTQLDFRISEDEIESQIADIDKRIAEMEAQGASGEQLDLLRFQRQVVLEQQSALIESIRTVLERRINALGVSEATITPSYVGREKHLIVECPGVVDVQKCIETVGKTIQLEFKEEETEATAEFEQTVRAKADQTFGNLGKSGATLQTLGEDFGDELGVVFQGPQWYVRRAGGGFEALPGGENPTVIPQMEGSAFETLWTQSGKSAVLKTEGFVTVPGRNEEGQIIEQRVPGVFLAQAVNPKTQTGRVVQEASVAFDLLAKGETGLENRFSENRALDTGVPALVIGAIKGMQPGELKTVDMEDGTAKLLFLRSFVPGSEQARASHILVAYKDAQAVPAGITRTKEEALARALEIKGRLTAANFAQIARTDSDAESKTQGGSLGAVVRGALPASVEKIIFGSPVNSISEPVESPFGYHIVRVDAAPVTTNDVASFDSLTVTGTGSATRATDLMTRLQNGGVRRTEDALQLQFLFFSLQPTGWKDTALDGKHFRSAAVTTDPTTNFPVVQIMFDEEGGKMFQELTKRNVNKRIAIFVGGQLVSAPTVQGEIIGGTAVITGSADFAEAQSLARDLNTGAIPAPIHLTGQRTVEATLGADSLRSSVQAALVGIIILMAYMIFMYRFLGVLADLTLAVYAVIFLALLKLPLFLFTNQYIVLTLAGAAGLILSIGMAVDTNVLVFERVKEELKKGKSLKTAVETGFAKAWPSIRDSNISTLITCALLFLIGTSIVRGFALTLGIGVLISMFTGMIVARIMARWIADRPIATNTVLFPGLRKEEAGQ